MWCRPARTGPLDNRADPRGFPLCGPSGSQISATLLRIASTISSDLTSNFSKLRKSTFRAACCLSRSTIYCDEDTRRSQEAYIGVLCALRLRAVVRKVNGRHVAVEEFFPYFSRTRAALLFMSLILWRPYGDSNLGYRRARRWPAARRARRCAHRLLGSADTRGRCNRRPDRQLFQFQYLACERRACRRS